MARIRTIKPDFFRHEGLQDLQAEHPGLNPMLVFTGLWCVADREGRFEWRPRRIKLDILPFLEFSMDAALELLSDAGFVFKYEVGGVQYGAISNWERHQLPGRDEAPSEIPAPDGVMTPYFRPLNQTQRFKVYERDKWTCTYCARNMKDDRRAACLDHVFPYARGGTNRENNLVTACKRCNTEKGNKTPIEAGFTWPEGKGEYLDKSTNLIRQYPFNPPLTGGVEGPDKERERERERERGKEEEEEGNGVSREPLAALVPIKPPDKPKTELQVVQAEPSEESAHQAKCRRTWAAYEVAYLKRYGTAPVRNAKVNSLVKQFVIRLGEEAEPVIAYYVNHAARWYVQIAHSLEGAVKDAEKLRMEWATNRKITTATATSSDRMQAASDALCDYLGALEVAQ